MKELDAWVMAVVIGAQPLFFGYLVVLMSFYFALFVSAMVPFRRQFVTRRAWGELSHASEVWPPLTVILPAYNEEAVIGECVSTMLRSDYPGLDVVVVCDGPKDRTFDVLVEQFSLTDAAFQEQRADFVTKPVLRVMRSVDYPNLMVILKQNGGKADALNVGLNAARTPLVCCCDADTLIEPGALRRLVVPFQENHVTVASSGALMLTNGAVFERGAGRPTQVGAPRSWLAAIQVVEYCRAFYLGRMGFDAWSAMLIISGAFGVFSRHAMVAVGGYNHATVGEDMDLVVRMHRHYRQKGEAYDITYVPSAVAWTEAPESLKMLKSQRMRWQRGLCEVISMHRGMLFDKGAGAPAWLGGTYFLLFEALAPLVEIIGSVFFVLLLFFGHAYWDAWGAMFAMALALLTLVTLGALTVQQLYAPVVTRSNDLVKLLGAAVLEMVFFKPLSSIWRVQATWKFLRGHTARWDPIARKGFSTK